MNGVQCYELFGGIALQNHAFFLLFLFYFHACYAVLKIPVVRGLPNGYGGYELCFGETFTANLNVISLNRAALLLWMLTTGVVISRLAIR